MQYKNSVLFLTALSVGSAVARLHGHDRRHAHAKVGDVAQNEEAPVVAPAAEKIADLEQRDEVYATIDGVLESWINNWAVEVSTTSTSTSTSIYVAPTTTTAPVAVFTSNPAVESTVTPVPTSSPSGGNWYETPSDGEYSRSGFGGSTASQSTGSLDWDYIGNVGSPWGSNIIQISEDVANQYKHVLRFEGSSSSSQTVVFWNTYGPNGKMDGFWSPNKALEFDVPANGVAYVAIDDNSQGGWAAGSDSVPLSGIGEYAGTWGEFDMSSEKNDGYSGWDVSSIIAQLAGLDVQGMRICNHEGEMCSSIATGLASLVNAYTSADQGNPSLAVSQAEGPVRLVVNLDWS
ncbi:uncharacterized protein N7483_000182 [Penicillium malachiteum]|uniref:uncharacterized protein n=1 Tax=Penicillium malachiteum TaxID=1324776 RepID=UPI0025495FB4|nr:uncharacterized protein N7483_000182 [Penicillium malachiteum]KAJ5735057.1 hypothetical protein N7483_000182 [Penicillium malachiteum]